MSGGLGYSSEIHQLPMDRLCRKSVQWTYLITWLWLSGLAGHTHGQLAADKATGTDARTDLTITVQDAHGEKLSGTEVVFMSETVGAVLNRKTLEGGSLRLSTDAKGCFSMPSPTNLFAVVANEYGFVLMQTSDFTNYPKMTLQPWGRIDGVRLNSGKPVSNLWVRFGLNPRYLASASDGTAYILDDVFSIKEHQVMTDIEGKFTFPTVPPGMITLRESPRTLKRQLFGYRQSLSLQPGESMRVTMESAAVAVEGRAVFGRSLQPDSIQKSVIWISPEEYLQKEAISPEIPKEKDTFDNRAAWWTEESKTEQGQRRRKLLVRRNALQLLSDGTLLGDLLSPGKYHIQAQFYDAKKEVAYIDQVIEIPSSAVEESALKPYDIGNILIKPALGDGDTAPDFAVKKLEGGSLKLTDLRGKYVLLDFWATWCGPCVEETPNLKAVYEEFGQDPRFTMVSLSLDENIQPVRDFVKREKLSWQQAFLGEWSLDKVLRSYGYSSIPRILLIDPAGTIVATDLRGESIKIAVAKALKK